MLEPIPRVLDYLLERAGFLEKMRGAGHEPEFLLGGQCPQRALIERDHLVIGAANDQQCGRPHTLERRLGEVGSAAAAIVDAGDAREDVDDIASKLEELQ